MANVPVIDYEGSQYKAEFWEGQDRGYEDAVERLAIKQLLPAHGGRIVEIGAGFGRLANLYLGYDQIVLFDYSRTMLQDAVRQWGDDPRFVFVAGNVYHLPLATGILDSLVMVRVMHHLANVPQALWQIERVLHRYSIGVIEFANKRNLKAILRWLLRRQNWSPYTLEPVEFVKLNFDFHPTWMRQRFDYANLEIRRQFAVSHFRLPFLKQKFRAEQLAAVDAFLFQIGGRLPVSPSVFLETRVRDGRSRADVGTTSDAIAGLFRCPACQSEEMKLIADDCLQCQHCSVRYAKIKGIWDFKEVI